MTLNQLRYFRVLAGTEHYTKAAAVLNIAQPSLSRAIALLEEELGVLLLCGISAAEPSGYRLAALPRW